MMTSKKKIDIRHMMIIFGCMLLQAVPYALTQNVPPLFIHYLHEDFQFNLANIGLIFTIGAVASSIVSPIGGKFYSKFSTKMVMFAGLLISCVGLFMNAFVSRLWLYFLANAIIQIGCVIYSSLGMPYLIGTWFDTKQKAQALGVAFAGGAIGNFFWQPIFVHLLHRYALNSIRGLHFVYFILACSALVAGILVFVFLLRDSHQKQQKATAQPTQHFTGIGARRTLHLPSFWLLALGMFFIGLNVSAQGSQYANFFDVMKMPATVLGIAGSILAIACLIGNVGGWCVVR